jgi:hypothetical protein
VYLNNILLHGNIYLLFWFLIFDDEIPIIHAICLPDMLILNSGNFSFLREPGEAVRNFFVAYQEVETQSYLAMASRTNDPINLQ